MIQINWNNSKTNRNGVYTHEGITTSTEAQQWVDENPNFFGTPARWLPDFLEGVETKVVIDQEAQEYDQPIYDEQGNEIGTEHVSIPEQSHTEYLHPAEYSYEIEDITAQYEAEQAYNAKLALGAKAKAVCDEALNYIRGWNITAGLTTEQINQMKADFSLVKEYLVDGQPYAAIATLTPIENPTYADLKATILTILNKVNA